MCKQLADLLPSAQIDLRSGEERAADKASKLDAVASPAQISVTAQAGRSLEEGHAPIEADEHGAQQREDGLTADNEVAAAAADTDSGKDGPQTASLIVHHVALLDKYDLMCLSSLLRLQSRLAIECEQRPCIALLCRPAGDSAMQRRQLQPCCPQEPILQGADATHTAGYSSQRTVLVAAQPAIRHVAHHPVSPAKLDCHSRSMLPWFSSAMMLRRQLNCVPGR